MQKVSSKNIKRVLMGPGPTNMAPSVREALSLPLIGHLDPVFIEIMEELSQGLRQLFGTKNQICFAASGTGSSGMELLATNFVEEGDVVVVGVNGVFGGRIVELCEKLKAKVIPIKVPFGQGITVQQLQDTINSAGGKVDLVWVVHAETSTGFIHNELKEFAEIAHKSGGLLFIDTVTGLGGCEVKIDEWGVDGAFSGTQKCLAVTPGLAPVTISPRAMEKFQKRKTPVPSWYFDIGKLLGYWTKGEGKRSYHHTAPISSCYGLHEGVRLLLEEGLENVQKRYRDLAAGLTKELEARGFTYAVQDLSHRLPNLHAVYPPSDIDEAKLRKNLLDDGIEIGAGLGEFAGKVVRIGIMGANADAKIIANFLTALDKALPNSKK